MADGAHGDSLRRLQRCLGSTQFLWVPGTHELESYTHTSVLMGTLFCAKIWLNIGVCIRLTGVSWIQVYFTVNVGRKFWDSSW